MTISLPFPLPSLLLKKKFLAPKELTVWRKVTRKGTRDDPMDEGNQRLLRIQRNRLKSHLPIGPTGLCASALGQALHEAARHSSERTRHGGPSSESSPSAGRDR